MGGLRSLTYDGRGPVLTSTDENTETTTLTYDVNGNLTSVTDAVTGRFLSEDPIGFGAGDANLYRYVFDNPINLTDPDGKIIPFIVAEGLRRCAFGAVIGGVAAANGAIFGKFGAGTKEKFKKKNSPRDCNESNDEPVLDAFDTLLDIGEAVGIGALSGCLTGVFQGVSGAAVGIAATAGAILGFAKGFFGGTEIDLSFGF